MTVDCTHGMPTPAACVDCMAAGNIPRQPRPQHRWSRPFPAAFPGRCHRCGDPIHPGDEIRFALGTSSGPAHADCIEEDA